MNKKDIAFNELINLHLPEIKNWIKKMDTLLIDGGCKVVVDNKGNFTYTSKQSNKIVCRITIGETECSVRPNTNYATTSNNITNQFPESMLDVMRNTRGCGGCAIKNPAFVKCKHGGPYQFKHGNEDFESCRYVGFNFTIDSEANRGLLEEWIKCELFM